MTADEPVGVPVPDEYVGAFVAEVFEDAERSTTWADAVDALVAPAARADWADLPPATQVVEVLDAAARFDDEAVRCFDGIPLDAETPGEPIRAAFEEARRHRRNADMLRNAVADAYAAGHVDDDQLVAAVERHGFESATIAEREARLEAVAEAYGFAVRPYGGTLVAPPDEADAGPEPRDAFDIEGR